MQGDKNRKLRGELKGRGWRQLPETGGQLDRASASEKRFVAESEVLEASGRIYIKSFNDRDESASNEGFPDDDTWWHRALPQSDCSMHLPPDKAMSPLSARTVSAQ